MEYKIPHHNVQFPKKIARYVPIVYRQMIRSIVEFIIYLHRRGKCTMGFDINNIFIKEGVIKFGLLRFEDLQVASEQKQLTDDYNRLRQLVQKLFFGYPNIPQDMISYVRLLNYRNGMNVDLLLDHVAVLSPLERVCFIRDSYERSIKMLGNDRTTAEYALFRVGVPKNWMRSTVMDRGVGPIHECYVNGSHYNDSGFKQRHWNLLRCMRNMIVHVKDTTNYFGVLFSDFEVETMVMHVFGKYIVKFQEELDEANGLSLLRFAASVNEKDDFTFNGFQGANLTLDGSASITPSGPLMLTNGTKQMKGHAFHPSPLHFRRSSPNGNGTVFSFSTTFVFGIIARDINKISGHGIAFVISPIEDLSGALGTQFLCLFNLSNNGNSTHHVFAIESDTVINPELQDIDDNHVGIDINSVISNMSHTAVIMMMQLAPPIAMAKPHKPLLSSVIDLSTTVFLDPMYVGFSASLGSLPTSHYILGWSFKMNGTARALDYSLLPSLPRIKSKDVSKFLEIGLPLISAGLVLITAAVVVFVVRRRIKYAELYEDWESEFGPHRISYKDLFEATKGFKDSEESTSACYRVLNWKLQQGMKQFIAEIVSMGRLRHRNIVQLLGYCRRKGELLLVYDYMLNGSLDRFLYDQTKPTLNWASRFWIIKGVASGLLYLHEDWEKVVLHREIKASNVLLDGDFNGRLGDFGLARLYDHGSDLLTTHVVGTMGYLAPELARTRKANTMTDVFAFGIFLLEVACGRRPVNYSIADGEPLVLLDWVVENWRKVSILATTDPRLGEAYAVEEMELVLKLGLLCTHPLPATRPAMRRVVQYLEGDAPLPELSPTYLSFKSISFLHGEGFDDYIMSYPSSKWMSSASDTSADR
ncbi:hypothetical protein Cni_G23945 [Canna indica]|uniref:Protein kinase domain-containing protein n=1 Tax=Canna indica TaxID=4628 RepID=A0AAQ3QL02_9LILI|nr:hypothetical protein Cni_G23945 [Canna indica]